MGNLYDKAHELARLIEENEHYVLVKNLTSKVMSNPEHMQLIEDFRRKQYEVQTKQMQGQPLEEGEIEETNKLYEQLSSHDDIKKLMESEEKLSNIFSDVNRILTGPLEKIYKKDQK